MEKFNLGDGVALKSGSMEMIVVKVSDCGKYTTVKYLSEGKNITEDIMRTELLTSCSIYKDKVFRIGDVVRNRLDGLEMVVSKIITDDFFRCELCYDDVICYKYYMKYELDLCKPF